MALFHRKYQIKVHIFDMQKRNNLSVKSQTDWRRTDQRL